MIDITDKGPVAVWLNVIESAMVKRPEQTQNGRCYNNGVVEAARVIGHATGNKALIRVADYLANELSRTQTVERSEKEAAK